MIKFETIKYTTSYETLCKIYEANKDMLEEVVEAKYHNAMQSTIVEEVDSVCSAEANYSDNKLEIEIYSIEDVVETMPDIYSRDLTRFDRIKELLYVREVLESIDEFDLAREVDEKINDYIPDMCDEWAELLENTFDYNPSGTYDLSDWFAENADIYFDASCGYVYNPVTFKMFHVQELNGKNACLNKIEEDCPKFSVGDIVRLKSIDEQDKNRFYEPYTFSGEDVEIVKIESPVDGMIIYQCKVVDDESGLIWPIFESNLEAK